MAVAAQRALTGIRRRELVRDAGNQMGGHSNHLILDDTADSIQAQLKSDHAVSQLSLGSITRIEGWQGRQDARGEGFELRTDAVGAIRSGKGMVVSTEARPSGQSHIADVGEPASRLAHAQAQHHELGKLAQQHQAQDSGGDPSGVAEALQAQVDGIRGRGARRGDGSFSELSEPHPLLAGAAGLQATTPATVHVSGGEHVALTAGRNVSVTAGKSLFASVAEKISLFVQNAGMKLFAAKGKVEIQAHTDNIELTAQKTVKVLSATENIEVASFRGIDDGSSMGDVDYTLFTIPSDGEAAKLVAAGISSADGAERKLNEENPDELALLFGLGEWGTYYDLNIDRSEADATDIGVAEGDGVI